MLEFKGFADGGEMVSDFRKGPSPDPVTVGFRKVTVCLDSNVFPHSQGLVPVSVRFQLHPIQTNPKG